MPRPRLPNACSIWSDCRRWPSDDIRRSAAASVWRCALGRAMVTRPRLLILDEPTAGLDILAREQVMATVQLLLDQTHAPTVLMITHHVEELPPATLRVLLLCGGQLAPPKERPAKCVRRFFRGPTAARCRCGPAADGSTWKSTPTPGGICCQAMVCGRILPCRKASNSVPPERFARSEPSQPFVLHRIASGDQRPRL